LLVSTLTRFPQIEQRTTRNEPGSATENSTRGTFPAPSRKSARCFRILRSLPSPRYGIRTETPERDTYNPSRFRAPAQTPMPGLGCRSFPALYIYPRPSFDGRRERHGPRDPHWKIVLDGDSDQIISVQPVSSQLNSLCPDHASTCCWGGGRGVYAGSVCWGLPDASRQSWVRVPTCRPFFSRSSKTSRC
jgi:hypothetical protein